MEQIKDMPISVGFPDEGCVFDYYLDLQTYQFEPWSKRKGRLSVRHTGYVPTPELSCVAYIAEVYLSYGYNIVLLGESGSGKTSFTQVRKMSYLVWVVYVWFVWSGCHMSGLSGLPFFPSYFLHS